jgi:hypothetical protein
MSNEFQKVYHPDILKLKLTASKVSLIELLSVLQSSGSSNK